MAPMMTFASSPAVAGGPGGGGGGSGSSGGSPLVTIVSYCSRERAFLEAVVSNARKFSDLVVVCVGTHLYTGEPEDVDAVSSLVVTDSTDATEAGAGEAGETCDLCAAIVAVYDVPKGLMATPILLHNRAREIGVYAARRAVGAGRDWWALLLDGDEVPDGPRVRAWWRGAGGDAVRAEPHGVRKMANRWAFLHPCLVAEELEDSVLLAHSSVVLHPHGSPLAHPRERDGVYLAHAASPLGLSDLRVHRQVLGDDGQPLFWHFSWVRGDLASWRRQLRPAAAAAFEAASGMTPGSPEADAGSSKADTANASTQGPEDGREALKAKVRNWGHKNDRDWPRLIDEMFDALAAGSWPTHDFVHGYPLRMVPPDACPIAGLVEP